MKNTDTVTIYTDGASRGNPGPAAYAYVIQREGAEDIEVAECLPETTNNVAEYTALVKALEHAEQLGARKAVVFADSELMVRQLQGTYKVKNEGLKPLYQEVQILWKQFDAVTVQHVPRSKNAHADRLCNEALDGKGKTASNTKAGKKHRPHKADVREEAIACLREVAKVWAQGNANDPKPEEVWEQLWTILDEGDVLR